VLPLKKTLLLAAFLTAIIINALFLVVTIACARQISESLKGPAFNSTEARGVN
jgi:hypothetical protein